MLAEGTGPAYVTYIIVHDTYLVLDEHVSVDRIRSEAERCGLQVAGTRLWGDSEDPGIVHVSLDADGGRALILRHDQDSEHGSHRFTRLHAVGMSSGDADIRLLEGLGTAFGGTLTDETGRSSRERAFMAPGEVDLGRKSIREGTVNLRWLPKPYGGSMKAVDEEGGTVGFVQFRATGKGVLVGDDLYVAAGCRRRGIATALYDAAESLGFKLEPSESLDEDGALFWDHRETTRIRPASPAP